jgi:uncharacterized membrane protein
MLSILESKTLAYIGLISCLSLALFISIMVASAQSLGPVTLIRAGWIIPLGVWRSLIILRGARQKDSALANIHILFPEAKVTLYDLTVKNNKVTVINSFKLLGTPPQGQGDLVFDFSTSSGAQQTSL